MHTWHRRGFLTAGVAAAVAMAGSRTAPTAHAEETDESTPSVRVRGSEGQATVKGGRGKSVIDGNAIKIAERSPSAISLVLFALSSFPLVAMIT